MFARTLLMGGLAAVALSTAALAEGSGTTQANPPGIVASRTVDRAPSTTAPSTAGTVTSQPSITKGNQLGATAAHAPDHAAGTTAGTAHPGSTASNAYGTMAGQAPGGAVTTTR